MNKDFEVTKNEFQRQYETKIDGELLAVEFSEHDRKIFLTKLTIPEQFID